MRIAFAGSKSFGAECLKWVVESGHDVGVVFTHFDDKLANVARYDYDLQVLPKVDYHALEGEGYDLIVAAHCYDFIGRKSRAATKYGALVGHPSLLPRHRGRSSVDWTVRMHDPIAGFTWFWADDGVDTGPVAIQDWCHVDRSWTASDLWQHELFPMGVRLLLEVLPSIAQIERYGFTPKVWRPQDPRFATVEPAIESDRLYRPELIALPGPPR